VTCHLLDIGKGVIAISGDGNCLMVKVEVTSILVGPNIGPQELYVEYFSVDKGCENVEVVISSMKADKDDSISGSECENDCMGEIGTVG
jgi:hypothetical protein